ncbi:hypothetical protein [Luteimonas saliphila]|uniref:hypothetical protein n=1 Tax=Luteimonas saliphila TaxID=2804919 RepID=UPI00192DC751|nr:hypothetical protein [Luteimonas saliphila]
MTPDEVEAALQRLAIDVAIWSNERAGRTPADFIAWFWERADEIKAQAPVELRELATVRIDDIVDGALDAALFGSEGDEDTPFPE